MMRGGGRIPSYLDMLSVRISSAVFCGSTVERNARGGRGGVGMGGGRRSRKRFVTDWHQIGSEGRQSERRREINE